MGVVGLGPLGRGIVACCLARGFAVVGIDLEQGNRDLFCDYLPEAAEQCVEAGVIDVGDSGYWQARLELSGEIESISRACLVIESIVEDLPAKKQLLQEVDDTIHADTPIGSSTSAFSITALQEGCKHPERVFGMHWSRHGHITRFMELTPGDQTSAETMALEEKMAARQGTSYIEEGHFGGGLCNRIAYTMYREAVNLLESAVADAASIECSFRNSVGLGAAMCGPLRMIDVMGGGAFYARAIKGVLPTLESSTELPETLQSFIDRDAKGPKNNIGFFDYDQGDQAEWAKRFIGAILATKHYQDQFIPCDNEEQDIATTSPSQVALT